MAGWRSGHPAVPLEWMWRRTPWWWRACVCTMAGRAWAWLVAGTVRALVSAVIAWNVSVWWRATSACTSVVAGLCGGELGFGWKTLHGDSVQRQAFHFGTCLFRCRRHSFRSQHSVRSRTRPREKMDCQRNSNRTSGHLDASSYTRLAFSSTSASLWCLRFSLAHPTLGNKSQWQPLRFSSTASGSSRP